MPTLKLATALPTPMGTTVKLVQLQDSGIITLINAPVHHRKQFGILPHKLVNAQPEDMGTIALNAQPHDIGTFNKITVFVLNQELFGIQ
jgi:hypothetical protein